MMNSLLSNVVSTPPLYAHQMKEAVAAFATPDLENRNGRQDKKSYLISSQKCQKEIKLAFLRVKIRKKII